MLVLTVLSWSRFLDPVSQMSHKVKEEVSLWYTDHLQTHTDMSAWNKLYVLRLALSTLRKTLCSDSHKNSMYVRKFYISASQKIGIS